MTRPSSTNPAARSKRGTNPADKAANWADERLTVSSPLRRALNKVFPDHWSFMLGEIALYSFIVLLLTGTYLTFFFDASQGEVKYGTEYPGSYAPLQGVEMTRAYASTLMLSFDVRGGLVMRQIHHWAALLFLGAMMVHLLRIFFTGAFRKPREINWLIGVTLLTLGLVEGFAGYSLPDDLLSGGGLRIASGIVLSIPVVGTWIYYMVFGSEFPGTEIIGRLYIVHVLLIPGLILALIAVHVSLVVKQKHTQFPGSGRTEGNVVGVRVMPLFATKGGGFFMLVFAMVALLGGVAQINPIWLYGPYNTSAVSAGSQPDFYMGFLEGSARIWPNMEFRGWGHTIPFMVLLPTVVLPGIMFTLLAVYPFVEARLTRDRAMHNLLQRPRDVPVRTALGVMGLVFYCWLWLLGGNDVWATVFDISLNATTWIGRVGIIVLPPIAYWVTYRICLGLQRHDREVLEHGVETGVIKRLPHGEFIEVHQPLGAVDAHGHGTLEYAGAPVPKKMNRLGGAGRAIRGFFAPVEEPPPLELPAREEAADRELAGRPKAD
jgi:ubiquinol-cytochrome c reductase cytochrome b subunit